MKWYKHMANTETSGLITELVEVLNIAGYGLFFRLLEVLASKCEAPDWSTTLRLTKAGWKRRLYCTDDQLKAFVDVVLDWAVLEMEADREPAITIEEKQGRWLEISAPKLLLYADRYTAEASGSRTKVPKRGRRTNRKSQPMVSTEQEHEKRTVCTDTTHKVHLNRIEGIESSSSGDGDEFTGEFPALDGPWAGIPAWMVSTNPEAEPGALQKAFPRYNYTDPSPYLVDRVADLLTRHPRAALEKALKICGENAAHSITYLDTVLANGHGKAGQKPKAQALGPKPSSKFAYNPKTGETRLHLPNKGDKLQPGEELV